jgi:prephenate dehydrogenase
MGSGRYHQEIAGAEFAVHDEPAIPSPALQGYDPPMAIDRISILGVGLMGGSVGLACRQVASNLQINGYSYRTEELEQAIQCGAIDRGSADAAVAVDGADLVILCTPVGLFGKMLGEIAPALKTGAIVTDVGSTKRTVVAQARQLLPAGARFVGSHPMTGGEKHGIENARADLLEGAVCIVTTTDGTDAAALETVERFWRSLRMRTVRMTPQVHDQLTGDISHLPHAAAAALVRVQSRQSIALAARGFLDTTRIAGGDAALWKDILLENRDNLRGGIVRLQAELQRLLEHLDSGDSAAVQDWLSAAAEVRSGLGKNAGSEVAM